MVTEALNVCVSGPLPKSRPTVELLCGRELGFRRKSDSPEGGTVELAKIWRLHHSISDDDWLEPPIIHSRTPDVDLIFIAYAKWDPLQ